MGCKEGWWVDSLNELGGNGLARTAPCSEAVDDDTRVVADGGLELSGADDQKKLAVTLKRGRDTSQT